MRTRGSITVCAISEHWHLEVRIHQLLLAGDSNLHRVDGITAAQPICIPEDFNRTDYIKRPYRRNRSNQNSHRLFGTAK